MASEIRVLIGSDINYPLFDFYYSGGHLKSVQGVSTSALAGEQLAIDTIDITVNLELYATSLYVPVGSDAYRDTNNLLYAVRGGTDGTGEALRNLPYATPIRIYHGGVLISKYYSDKVTRVALYEYKIRGISIIGVLEGQQHMGGIYSGIDFIDLLVQIIGGTKGSETNDVIPVTGGLARFYVSTNVATVKVFGWLPISTKRANIHQMLFAHSVNIFKHDDCDMLFDYLTRTGARTIGDDNIFFSGSVNYTPPATRIELTEHSYTALPTDEETVLLNNVSGGAPTDLTTVTFGDGPAHDYSAEGSLTIIESGPNYVKVQGAGVLKGKKYHHVTNVLSVDSESSSGEMKVATSKNCTLISPLNGDAVLKRLLSYYLSARTIQADIKLSNETPGELLSFNNVFREPEVAYIASMNFNITGFLRANCKLIADYDPANRGNEYKNVTTITSSGTWTVPTSVEKIMVVLIGGGTGGTAGHPGETVPAAGGGEYYTEGDNVYTDTPGAGGAPGSPGGGGKIFKASLDVSSGQTFNIAIGAGGAGSTSADTPGSAGSDTTFGSLSSANGYSSSSGFTELLSGTIYAYQGDEGISGGSGVGPNDPSEDIIIDGVHYTPGARGDHYYYSTEHGCWMNAQGAFGGGPAYKANGGKGRDGVFEREVSQYIYSVGRIYYAYFTIPTGGTGATAQPPPKPTVRGRGGTGGNGGGGAGCDSPPQVNVNRAAARHIDALGGSGSAGGDGGDGVCLIYY